MITPGPQDWPAPDPGVLDEAMRQLKAEHDKIIGVQRRMKEMSATAASRDRAVSVTVDGRGEVAQVSFTGNKYRSMPPAELGKVVTETIAEARRQVFEQLGGVMGPMLPPGIDVRAALTGDLDLTAVVDDLVGGFEFFTTTGKDESNGLRH
ncbi:MAG TPA: YbaB/EbfC family nucleoid-associated protein [Actinophytocola sp.]|uniref:YbaB/EbfC family nucleoid-associated protein n=1 Tax=Actinophytocola sp. TaxID=1872138 RepID=UPI002DF98B37|nr:YbaB/EbfC family nucleoid-associated protein [Actinophytocola sp.]